jgi:RNA polymerase sigma-70 factor (ECF subfamily)
VFAFAYSRVGNADTAKDLAAEVFERAYIKGHEVRNAEAYGAWLFAIAKNVITSHYRRQQRDEDMKERMRDSLQLVSRPESPEEHLLKSEWASHVMGRVSLLTPRDQELLSLKFDAQLKNAEIALVMGMSEGNVRISVFRAVRRLRDYIKNETEGVLRARPAQSRQRARVPSAAPPARRAERIRLATDASS